MKKPVKERKSYIRKSALYTLLPLLVVLAATGRLNWVIAAMGVVAAFVSRFLPLALRYAPQLQRLWAAFRGRESYTKENPGGQGAAATMTTDEACKVLGVSATATRQEVIDAHRRLILKNHPDRGGSSYLAAQINRAKELLLKHY